MKKYIILLLAATLGAISCYEDESTFADIEYPEIVISTSFESDTLSIAFGDYLDISADAVQEGIDPSMLEYLWEIDLKPGSTKDRAFLSDTREVNMRVTMPPSSEPYILTLTVRNIESGYSRIKYWPVYIISSLGEGILVAHTKDGGNTSELALLSAAPVTYGYVSETPRVTNDLFEIGNGMHIDGKVNHILARTATDLNQPVISSFNMDMLMVCTDDHMYALDPVSYSVKYTDADLFMTNSNKSFKVQTMGNVGGYSTYAVIDGSIFTCTDMLDYVYGNASYPPHTELMGPENTTAAADIQGWIYVFDSEVHRFFFLPGWCAASASFSEVGDPVSPSLSFLQDKSSVACGILKSLRAGYILTDSKGKYYFVVLNGNDNAASICVETVFPEIENAISFAFCDNTDVFFYTNGKSIYSSVLSGNNVSTRALNWTPDSPDERVTYITQYRQAWYGTHQYDLYGTGSSTYNFPLQYHRLQIVVVTHNDKTGEGKIYLKPFNISTGLFSAFKDNGTYGGFGEITAIGTTMR